MASTYRSEHIGSLLRPPELLKARADFADGNVSAEELRAAEDAAIADVIKLQETIGLDVVNDGEFRRGGWFTGFFDAVDGFELRDVVRERRGPQGFVEIKSRHNTIVGKLKAKHRIAKEESVFVRAHAKAPYKVTLPSSIVFMMTSYVPGISDTAYPTRADAAKDLSQILRSEIFALIGEGVPYIQIDAPQYMQIADPSHHDRLNRINWNPEQALDDAITADIATLRGVRRPGSTVGLHLCRGNVRGLWIAEGGYDAIAERLFNSLDVDRFLLEYDSDRAGTFAPLRFVPKGTTVVLGLVTTKVPQLESADDLLRRIEEAAKYVPIERLALSPQCGFATQAAGNPVSFDDERRKLELIVDVSRRVWPEKMARVTP
jgi:5-methyltetrahydropteroyltriglutamate--homocysteine methyltransferase